MIALITWYCYAMSAIIRCITACTVQKQKTRYSVILHGWVKTYEADGMGKKHEDRAW